jgi:hypothetical protein
VFFRQVLARDADLQAVIQQLPVDAVVVLAPGQASGGRAGDRLIRRAGAAAELQRVASDETAR